MGRGSRFLGCLHSSPRSAACWRFGVSRWLCLAAARYRAFDLRSNSSARPFLPDPLSGCFFWSPSASPVYPLRRISGSAQSRKSITTVVLGVSAVALLAWATLSYRGLPMPVAITLAVAALLAGLLSNTVWGRHVFAVGGNRSAAKLSGIRVGRHIVIGYVLIGVLTAIASLMFVGRLGAAPPEAGYFLELNAISAVVIGGASLYGGTGAAPGCCWGRSSCKASRTACR